MVYKFCIVVLFVRKEYDVSLENYYLEIINVVNMIKFIGKLF